MLQQNREPSQAQVFAKSWARDAAKEMLAVLDRVNKRGSRITKLVLGASMPHQISYILALVIPWMDWTGPTGILESIGMTLIAFSVPIGTDWLILSCIEMVGARAASSRSRYMALGLMVIPVCASGFVNFDAPGPTLVKVLAGFLVTLVPMSQALRFAVPNFHKVDKLETDVVASVTPAEEPKAEMKKGPSKRAKAMKILAENPGITATELSRRIKCHYNYAYSLKQEFAKLQEPVLEAV
jgi:hypothetical protein